MGDDEAGMGDLLGTRIHSVIPGDSSGVQPAEAAEERRLPAPEDATGTTGDAEGDQVTSDEAPGAEAFVYVPVQPRRPGSDPNTVTFELRSIDGEPGLAVYTYRDRLVEELGEHQPHVRVPVLQLLVRLSRETIPIAVDPSLEPGAEIWTEESIRTWKTTE